MIGNSESDNAKRLGGFFELVAVLWLTIAVFELGLGAAIPETVLREPALDGWLVIALLATNLAAWFVVVPLLCLVLLPIARRAGTRWLPWGVLTVLVFLLVFSYVASWVSFRMTVRFIDLGGLEFFGTSSFQLLQHVVHLDPVLLIAAPAAALLTSALVPWGLRQAGRRTPAGVKRGVVRVALVLGVLCLGIAVWGHVAFVGSRAPTRLSVRVVPPEVGPVYRYSRDERNGPLLHAIADLRRLLLHRPPKLQPDPAIEVLRKPQTSLAEWARQVDRGAVKEWNVIVLVVESLRPDQIVATGGKRKVMPVVERIAAESLIPARCYAQASHSDYADLCPLSSHYPLRGATIHRYPEDPPYPRVLIYDILKKLGWRTAIFSSQNESWGQMRNYLSTGNLDRFLHSETYEGETYVPRDDTGFAKWAKGKKRAGKIDDRFTVNEAIRWIGESRERFCIYMNLQNSHVPYEVPTDFPRRFGPDPKTLDFKLLFASFPPDKASVVKDIYANSLAYVDHQLGRFVKFLEETGRWKDTLFVLTGDTGQAFYEHGFAAHGSHVFDEVMRVPLVIRIPGRGQQRLDYTAEHVDVLPTVLHALGLPPHPTCQGLDLLAKDLPRPRSAFVLVQNSVYEEYATIRWPWKLIHFARQGHEMLFDLARDPGEADNVLDRNPDVAAELRRRLQTWRFEQIDFYERADRHSAEYPPILRH